MMRILLCLLLGLSFSLVAQPTLTGNGNTANAGAGSTDTIPTNVGSPAAGTLVVVAIGCNDITNTNAPVVSAPSGSWVEHADEVSADTFHDHKVFSLVAAGTEGATEDFTLPAVQDVICGSWYWTFTGYNTTDPADCTDAAYVESGTQDPPSQTFTSGPRDGYVVAVANERGDKGVPGTPTDLANTGTLDPAGINNGRVVHAGWGPYTVQSAVDPGAVVWGGTGRFGVAATCVVYEAVAAGGFNPILGPTSLPGTVQ